MAKNVVLKDSLGNELNPKTTIEQVGLTAGSDGKLDGSSISDSSITSDKLGVGSMEGLKDKHNDLRFIELNASQLGVYSEIIQHTEEHPGYFCASLSGTHLMVVAAGAVNSTYVTRGGARFFRIALPKYISDRIYGVNDQNIVGVWDVELYYASNGQYYTTPMLGVLWLERKPEDTYDWLYFTSARGIAEPEHESYIRIQIDLVIGTENH